MQKNNMVISVPKGQESATYTDDFFTVPSICDGVVPQPLPSSQSASKSYLMSYHMWV
jgi:hypothetical protein